MISDNVLTHSMDETIFEMMATSCEKLVEHRSFLMWEFTHFVYEASRFGVEVGLINQNGDDFNMIGFLEMGTSCEKGLGNWLLSHERASPKTQRSTRSKGRSSVPERLPVSIVGNTVADCNDQTSLEEFASSTDSAMEKTMEKPSAAFESGNKGINVQRIEAQLRRRNNVSMSSDKTRVHPAGEVLLAAGDSSHEVG